MELVSLSLSLCEQNGMTALHIATLNGHRKLVASLIADGFYVDAQDGQGR